MTFIFRDVSFMVRFLHKFYLLLSFLIFHSLLLGQTNATVYPDSTNSPKSITLNEWKTRQYFGGQIGYSRLNENQFDLGVNYYWSKMRHFDAGEKPDIYHTFGPSLACIVMKNNNNTLVGTQIGFNYHYYYSICPRIQLMYEDYFNQYRSLGIDFGLSVLGVYSYLGYHYPIAKSENIYVSEFRFGFKFIFNQALLKTVGMNWH